MRVVSSVLFTQNRAALVTLELSERKQAKGKQ